MAIEGPNLTAPVYLATAGKGPNSGDRPDGSRSLVWLESSAYRLIWQTTVRGKSALFLYASIAESCIVRTKSKSWHLRYGQPRREAQSPRTTFSSIHQIRLYQPYPPPSLTCARRLFAAIGAEGPVERKHIESVRYSARPCRMYDDAWFLTGSGSTRAELDKPRHRRRTSLLQQPNVKTLGPLHSIHSSISDQNRS